MVSELAAQMLSFETRVDLCSNGSASSANFARRGRGVLIVVLLDVDEVAVVIAFQCRDGTISR
jgi:hypothetical protein